MTRISDLVSPGSFLDAMSPDALRTDLAKIHNAEHAQRFMFVTLRHIADLDKSSDISVAIELARQALIRVDSPS